LQSNNDGCAGFSFTSSQFDQWLLTIGATWTHPHRAYYWSKKINNKAC